MSDPGGEEVPAVEAPFSIVIPARYASARLPGKPLRKLHGRPLIEYVYRAACRAGASRVAVATDDPRIAECAEAFGAETVLTSADHPTGTDRLAEVVTGWNLPDEAVVVNCQGDEPLLPPALPAEVARALLCDPDARIATAAEVLDDPDAVFDPGVVKVVRNAAGRALHFSRAPIPWSRDFFPDRAGEALAQAPRGTWLRHIGIYAYRAGFLRAYPGLAPVAIEQVEQLEQWRALGHGYGIQVAVTDHPPGPGVDTLDDLAAVEARLARSGASGADPEGP